MNLLPTTGSDLQTISNILKCCMSFLWMDLHIEMTSNSKIRTLNRHVCSIWSTWDDPVTPGTASLWRCHCDPAAPPGCNAINRPWLGMVNIPPIKWWWLGDGLWHCFTHIMSNYNKPKEETIGSRIRLHINDSYGSTKNEHQLGNTIDAILERINLKQNVDEFM